MVKCSVIGVNKLSLSCHIFQCHILRKNVTYINWLFKISYLNQGYSTKRCLYTNSIKLTLLKDKPNIGDNNYSEFYIYSAKDDQGIKYSYFADVSIYNLMHEHKLKS